MSQKSNEMMNGHKYKAVKIESRGLYQSITTKFISLFIQMKHFKGSHHVSEQLGLFAQSRVVHIFVYILKCMFFIFMWTKILKHIIYKYVEIKQLSNFPK